MAEASLASSPLPPDIRSRIVKRQYAHDNVLQTYETYVPEGEDGTATEENGKVWIVYIHGGAWRAPQLLAPSFHKTLSLLITSSLSSKVAGYASLDYRLSPDPQNLQDPTKTPSYKLRNALHPDHIHDIIAALSSMQQFYEFSSRYILVGHSAGATLSYQIAMSPTTPWNLNSPQIRPSSLEPGTHAVQPLAILGVCGIYSIPALLQSFSSIPVYREFICAAFGSDEKVWKSASPSNWSSYPGSWKNGSKRLAYIAHSRGDELVDWKQAELMEETLNSAAAAAAARPSDAIVTKTIELRGNHDQVWEEGEELAKAIGVVLKDLA